MLQVGRVELPALGEREVLVKIHAVGVNPQETYVRAGNYAQLPALPWTPGKDAAGVVVDSKSARWRAGDRVFTMLTKTGAYAEMAVAAEDQLFRLPDRVSFAHGAGLGVAFVAAYRALFEKARARPGQSLLVHGASGGVFGIFCLLARTCSTELPTRLDLPSVPPGRTRESHSSSEWKRSTESEESAYW